MVTLQNKQLKVCILEKGAEVCSITDPQNTEFIWQADKNVWPRHAPVLFPIVGKLKNDHFQYKGQNFKLGQHGFARDCEFKVIQTANDSCTLELNRSAVEENDFPFDFILQIKYRLQDNTLTCAYEVTNPSPDPLYFSIGAHPGFSSRLAEGESLSDFYLQFETDTLTQTLLSGGLRSHNQQTLHLENGRLPLHPTLFDNDALVFENSQISRVQLVSQKTEHRIDMRCANWPYFGIWTKKGCADFICLEPWYGIADAENTQGELSQKEGILSLSSGNAFHCAYAVTFS